MLTLEKVDFLSRLGPTIHLGGFQWTRQWRRPLIKIHKHPRVRKATGQYYHTAEYRSSFIRLLRNMLGIGHTQFTHPDLIQSRIRKDERDVVSLMDMLQNNWTNPFTNSQLISLSSGMLAPSDVAQDLLHAKDFGESAYKMFREERLETDPPTKKFHDPLKKQNLKIFRSFEDQVNIPNWSKTGDCESRS